MAYTNSDFKKHELDNIIENIIVNGFSSSKQIEVLDKFGAFLADKYYQGGKPKNGKKEVSTSQIRIVYGELTRIKMKKPFDVHSLLMLKAKMAYAAARKNNTKTYRTLRDIISHSIDIIDSQDTEEQKYNTFLNFASFFEAIIAYHKSNGGD